MQTQCYRDPYSHAERQRKTVARMLDRLPDSGGTIIVRISNSISNERHFGCLRLYIEAGGVIGGATLKEGVYPCEPYRFVGMSRLALATWLCKEPADVLDHMDQYHEVRASRNNAGIWVDGHSIEAGDFLVG